ncbi:hypothetical protein NKR23_g3549 [Pleurostoma richardsiae]|uniref:Uncharacterized protein n=1 Tax=Pleurostoma richardsiae TaxID=41990 RepID=A0AA38VH55_9PEZI|nr:hypothetical protein NKR23_g3549 [Pleurostoma richardsiae]
MRLIVVRQLRVLDAEDNAILPIGSRRTSLSQRSFAFPPRPPSEYNYEPWPVLIFYEHKKNDAQAYAQSKIFQFVAMNNAQRT